MVELRHIDGAVYNEIGDLIGDGVSRVAARTWVRDLEKRLPAVAGDSVRELLADLSSARTPAHRGIQRDSQPTHAPHPGVRAMKKGSRFLKTACCNWPRRQYWNLRLSALQAFPRQVGRPDLGGAGLAWYCWGERQLGDRQRTALMVAVAHSCA